MADTKILNTEQIEAIKHGDGPLLIIAGAGTGKTTVITERIKHLILSKNISPSEILALTFTEKASKEMEERVDIAMPYGYTQMWISTFHAFCDRILRSEAIHIGLNPSFKLISEAETILFLRKNLFELKLDYFRPLGNPTKFLSGMLQHFSRLRDEDVNPEEYIKYSQEISNLKPQISNKELNAKRYTLDADRDEIKKNLELANAYLKYQELKDKEGLMDFSDLIANTLKLFRTRKNILKSYQNRFKYVLVDEFQDTNFAQNSLAILLAGDKKNISVVGDDDQAIYRWRGAAISNMVQFKKQFKKAKIVTLTKNYRSTQEILDSSYTLIQQNNPDRLEVKEKVNKKLTSMRKSKGKPASQRGEEIEFLFEQRVEDEAETVRRRIQELIEEKKYQYKDIAILLRANDHSQPFVRSFIRHAIPFQFLGPGRLFHQEEIKDLISYLKVLYNFEDSASLYRILNLPIFNIESRDIASLLNFARRKNLTLFEGLEHLSELSLPEEVQEKMQTVLKMILLHLKKISTDSAGQILYYFLQDTGLLKKFLTPKTTGDEKKYQNIAKFFDKLKTYEAEHEDASVFAVVDWIDLSMQMGESPLASDIDWTEVNAVNLLTVHSSKGLEFPIVFIVNLVSQRFPVRERTEQIPIPQELIKEILPTGDFHLQEERRLFYVAMTRARDYLFFTASHFYGEGKRERKISPFVHEALGEEYLSKYLETQKEKRTVFQPSLLEWGEARESSMTLKEAPTQKNPSALHLTYISYSQIQTFAICPLHYKLRYLLKIPSGMTPALSFGISVHSALRDFYKAWIADGSIPKDRIVTFLKNVWSDEGYQSKIHEKQAFERASHILSHYLNEYFNPKIAKPVAIEVPFQIILRDLEKHPFLKVAGRIDRIDQIAGGKIEIIDYKTGTNVPEEKKLAKDLQLTMYGFAAHYIQTPPFNRKPEDISLSLFYLEEDIKLTTVRTLKELEECKSEIFAKVEEIEKSDFACSGSILCKNCEYKMLCFTKI